jgi:hypothetical protein
MHVQHFAATITRAPWRVNHAAVRTCATFARARSLSARRLSQHIALAAELADDAKKAAFR